MDKMRNDARANKCNFPMTPPVRPLVGQSVGWAVSKFVDRSVCHNFLKGREVTLPCYYRGTFYIVYFLWQNDNWDKKLKSKN